MEYLEKRSYKASELAGDWAWIGHFVAVRPNAVGRKNRVEFEEAHALESGTVLLVQVIPGQTIADMPRVHRRYVPADMCFVLMPIIKD
jgi:hypothetical protein